jgi:hypothetical protein
VPIDDDNVTTFHFYFRVDGPITAEDETLLASGVAFPPRLEKGTVQLGGRSPIDTFLPVANRTNDFLVDREKQRTLNFTGIHGANEQDRALQESMQMVPGTNIVAREHEHLIGSDAAIVAMRRRLLRLARALAEGREPDEPHDADGFAARAISKICDITDFDVLREHHAEDLKVPAERSGDVAAGG